MVDNFIIMVLQFYNNYNNNNNSNKNFIIHDKYTATDIKVYDNHTINHSNHKITVKQQKI